MSLMDSLLSSSGTIGGSISVNGLPAAGAGGPGFIHRRASKLRKNEMIFLASTEAENEVAKLRSEMLDELQAIESNIAPCEEL